MTPLVRAHRGLSNKYNNFDWRNIEISIQQCLQVNLEKVPFDKLWYSTVNSVIQNFWSKYFIK